MKCLEISKEKSWFYLHSVSLQPLETECVVGKERKPQGPWTIYQFYIHPRQSEVDSVYMGDGALLFEILEEMGSLFFSCYSTTVTSIPLTFSGLFRNAHPLDSLLGEGHLWGRDSRLLTPRMNSAVSWPLGFGWVPLAGSVKTCAWLRNVIFVKTFSFLSIVDVFSFYHSALSSPTLISGNCRSLTYFWVQLVKCVWNHIVFAFLRLAYFICPPNSSVLYITGLQCLLRPNSPSGGEGFLIVFKSIRPLRAA